MPLASVENEIDPGINTLVADAGKMRHPGTPLRRIVSDKVAAFPRQEIGCAQASLWIRPHKLHLQELHIRGRCIAGTGGTFLLRFARNQTQNSAVGAEKKAISSATANEFCSRVRWIKAPLPLIGLEIERQPG